MKKLTWNFLSIQWIRPACAGCILVVLSACGGGSDSNSTPPSAPPSAYSYQAPAAANDGWQTAHLADFGINDYALTTMMDNIRNDVSGYRFVDHVLIVKNNKLLFDEPIRTSLDIADGWANNQDINLHVLNSVTKSVVSSLIGIAIDQGLIPGVDVKVHDYFQHKQPIGNWTEAKSNITLKNWLTMRHGYLWDEWNVNYLDSSNLNAQMNNAQDPIAFLLNRPMATEPGITFAYSTGVSFALGRLLEHASGQSVTSFMEQNLFAPLGITNYDYWALDGQLHTGSALYLSARDAAKFGQLFLNEGSWNGEQVISAEWVRESTRMHVDLQNSDYGYQWWITHFTVNGQPIEGYRGDGFGGQYIIVLPSLDAVVVLFGRAYQDGQQSQYLWRMLMEQHILPSLLQSQ
ncbi:serine hydrolase [Aliiglaciecola sp. CAU 1673]|uniref:serine hydrolase domain-containing protein n=1 Tax=Aliiglaciecola sp. CAU 1673 TaxID=3032595 RepID=UPI0023D9BDB7|nr:serine hydrolase [Aliiglaciecola sp. CAU 1673]MDF2176931.1 serine hydrolase [Aliiglaciecola sp. CAU 1673]